MSTSFLLSCTIALIVALPSDVASFSAPRHYFPSHRQGTCVSSSSTPPLPPPSITTTTTALNAKKQKNKSSGAPGGGGGFGNKPAAAAVASVAPVSADKDSLEKQWDSFASITDLEIVPPGNPDDEDYRHFIVADVFVRVGPPPPSDAAYADSSGAADNADRNGASGDHGDALTGWYRTGKVVAAGESADIHASLTLQRGLILWTAVHVWPVLSAKGGKAAAQRLQLGYSRPTMYMADETDGALDEEEAEDLVELSHRVRALRGVVSIKDVGFRPDFNPPGFTYKRRERAAMKNRKSAMEEIAEVS